MPRRACIQHGCTQLATPGQARCPAHRLGYTNRERQRMRQAVAEWTAIHGGWCPGYGRPPHESLDLTADHVTPIKLGGSGGALTVLCRSCNGRRGANTA